MSGITIFFAIIKVLSDDLGVRDGRGKEPRWDRQQAVWEAALRPGSPCHYNNNHFAVLLKSWTKVKVEYVATNKAKIFCQSIHEEVQHSRSISSHQSVWQIMWFNWASNNVFITVISCFLTICSSHSIGFFWQGQMIEHRCQWLKHVTHSQRNRTKSFPLCSARPYKAVVILSVCQKRPPLCQ